MYSIHKQISDQMTDKKNKGNDLTLAADAEVARANLVAELPFLFGGHLLVLLGRRPPVVGVDRRRRKHVLLLVDAR